MTIVIIKVPFRGYRGNRDYYGDGFFTNIRKIVGEVGKSVEENILVNCQGSLIKI